ncbi:MAG: UDP-N-acetylmuramoyl-L-alanyl-D-glutamate--2,6-diaminopimelate ligase [Clostridia bacterium]|nr:UDP-N-acetylmuramoyl-L-alanyl-D-glutamate--2,6-diaminopimelate ligase [Clostridia bacterium]
MTLSELLSGVSGAEEFRPETDEEIKGITCDSRRVERGFVFVCIPGTAVDGHRFAKAAENAGAALVVTQRPLGLRSELTVPSARRTWAELCANWFGRPAERLRMIGITGTNGKTSTTYMLKAILEQAGCKVGLIGTIQNMVGDRVLPSGHTTPDPYDLQSMLSLMVKEGCTHVVMEVSSHALDQERVAGCAFDAAIFTNLTQDHLDYHKTMEAYCEAKKKLFAQADCAIVNADDAWATAIADGFTGRLCRFSAAGAAAEYTAENICTKADGVAFDLRGPQGSGRITLAIPGRFSVYNAMGSAVCALALGVPFETVQEALSGTCGVKGRAEVVPTGRDFTVVIDYAHTPDGLENIGKTLKDCAEGRLVVLFGCGGDRDKTKRPKMAAIAAKYGDFVVVTSDNPRSEDPAAIIADILAGLPQGTPHIVIENRVDAIRWALQNAQPGDTLLLAGKGHETYQILKDTVIHLDEREVIADALKEL